MLQRHIGGRASPKHTDSIRMAEASAFFMSSIRDPFNPRHCGRCLDGALYESTLPVQNVRETATMKPKKELNFNPELWDAIVTFLFLKRSDTQIKKLLTRLATCHCGTDSSLVCRDQRQLAIWRYHDIGESTVNHALARTAMDRDDAFAQGEFNPTKEFDVYSCAFIINMFSALVVPISQCSDRFAAKGSSHIWPLNLTNLLPLGPDNFVESMLQWHRFIPDSIIFNVTALVLRACKMRVIPSLIKFHFSAVVIQSTRTTVDRSLDNLDSAFNHPCPHTPTQKHSIIHTIQKTAWRVGNCIQDYRVYLSACTHSVSFAQCISLLRGQTTKAKQVCSMLIYLSSNSKSSKDKDAEPLAVLAQFLYRNFQMHCQQYPDMPVHPLIHKIDSACYPLRFYGNKYWSDALGQIFKIRGGNLCTTSDCQNSLQTAGKQFQRCGRCFTAGYCSRECQVKAWKEGDFPHKRVCPALRRLIDAGGGPEVFYSGFKETSVRTAIPVTGIVAMWKTTNPNTQDLVLAAEWGESIQYSTQYPRHDNTQYIPGYDDYDQIIARLSVRNLPSICLKRDHATGGAIYN